MPKRQELIEEACTEIGRYFGSITKDRFIEMVLEMQPQYDIEEGKVVFYDVKSEIAKAVVNMTDGGFYAEDIAGMSALNGIDPESKALVQSAFQLVCKDDITNDFAEIRHSFVPMADMLGELGNGVNQNSPPTRDKPALSILQVLPVELNFGNRDTGALEIFLNSIPPLEWTRCVPYLEAQLITPGHVIQGGKIAKASLMRFLMGTASPAEGSPDYTMASATSAEIAGMNFQAVIDAQIETEAAAAGATEAELAEGVEAAIPATFSSSGMELFTAPQTLIPANEEYISYDSVAYSIDAWKAKMEADIAAAESATGIDFSSLMDDFILPGEPGSNRPAPIIDRMRPFMSINSVDISVKPTRGMMSHKSAKIKLTLHDRSRLAEIAELVKPSSFSQSEILLEYGWSHPDGTVGGNNSFGKLINSLRVKEKFGVYNTAYSFDDAGQVKITLDLVTKGAAHLNISDIGMSGAVAAKWYAVEKLIEKIRGVRRDVLADEGMRDVIGMSVISSLSPTNLADSFDGEKLQELNAFISNSLNSENEDMAELAGYIDTLKDDVNSFNTTIGNVIKSKTEQCRAEGDPFLTSRTGTPMCSYWAKAGQSGIQVADQPSERKPTNTVWCSFAKLMSIFVGLPIAESGRFEEVQMIYYAFNDSCSYLNTLNIGSMPIEMTGDNGFEKLFKTYQEEKVQVSPARFLSFMNKEFINNQAAAHYGFSKLYSRDDEGNVEMRDSAKNNPGSTKSFKDEVLEDAYGPGSDMKFKLPRVQMYMEAVPHVSPIETPDVAGQPWAPSQANTILRLHFFDSVATKYAGVADLIRISRNSDMGALGSTLRDITKVEDGDMSQHAKAFNDVITTAVEANLLQMITATDGTTYYRMGGGVPRLKHFVKTSVPTLIYGAQNSSVNSLSADSMHNSKDTTVHMLRAQQNASSDQGAPGEQDRGLPLRMMPMKLKVKTFGCPIIAHGQQMFIDLGTGTTVDNIYAVNGLQHEITPGGFKTSFEMIPFGDAWGSYESLDNMISKASATIAAGGSDNL